MNIARCEGTHQVEKETPRDLVDFTVSENNRLINWHNCGAAGAAREQPLRELPKHFTVKSGEPTNQDTTGLSLIYHAGSAAAGCLRRVSSHRPAPAISNTPRARPELSAGQHYRPN